MIIATGFIDAIGNTPMIELRKLSEMTGCRILGKCEFMNPGGSVKDRAAKAIILDAIEKGQLKPGGTIVEGTAGNTGISLALAGNSLGYKTIIVIPRTQSQEKKDFLRLCGATLHEVDAVPYKDPNNFVKVSKRLADDKASNSQNSVIWANQFDNIANKQGHFLTTAPEIFAQIEGKIDGFICACGSGGTLAGIAEFLKSKNDNIKIGLADPMGAALYHYYKYGELKSEGSSIAEGIGQGRITENLKELQVDMPFQINDADALTLLFDLFINEGLCLGGSSAINIAGALAMAKEMGPGHTIVTILCDGGVRYQSKLYNPDFLREKNLPVPSWL